MRAQRDCHRLNKHILGGMRCAVQLYSEDRPYVLDNRVAHARNIGEFKPPLAGPAQLGGHLVHFAGVKTNVEVGRCKTMPARLSASRQNREFTDTRWAGESLPAGFPAYRGRGPDA